MCATNRQCSKQALNKIEAASKIPAACAKGGSMTAKRGARLVKQVAAMPIAARNKIWDNRFRPMSGTSRHAISIPVDTSGTNSKAGLAAVMVPVAGCSSAASRCVTTAEVPLIEKTDRLNRNHESRYQLRYLPSKSIELCYRNQPISKAI